MPPNSQFTQVEMHQRSAIHKKRSRRLGIGSLGRPGLRVDDKPTWSHVRTYMVKPAFTALRKLGIWATVNKLACCANCCNKNHDALADEWVGFHMQSNPEPLESFQFLFLRHKLDDETKPLVREVFADKGFLVDWDNSNKKTIMLRLPSSGRAYWNKLRLLWKTRYIFYWWLESSQKHKHSPLGVVGQQLKIRYTNDESPDEEDPAQGEPGWDYELLSSINVCRSWTFYHISNQQFEKLIESGEWIEPGIGPKGVDYDQKCAELNGAQVKGVVLRARWAGGDYLTAEQYDRPIFRGPHVNVKTYESVHDARDGAPQGHYHTQQSYNNKGWFSVAEMLRAVHPAMVFSGRCRRTWNDSQIDLVTEIIQLETLITSDKIAREFYQYTEKIDTLRVPILA